MPNEADGDGYGYGYGELEEQSESLPLPAQLRDPIGVLRRQYRWILATLLLTSIIVASVTATAPRQYQARATIRLTAKSIPDEFVPTTIIANILEQFEAIRGEVFSRSHLSVVIEETGVYADEQKKSSRAALVGRLRGDLLVEPLRGGVQTRGAPRSVGFAVTMVGEKPEILAAVVNRTVADLIDENLAYRSRQARLTTRFMQREYERADTALRAHQRELADFRELNRGALPEERSTAISRLERLEEQRRSAILRLSDFQARLDHLDSRPQLVGTAKNLKSLRERLRVARTLYTDDHPTVRSLERQLGAMETDGGSEETAPDPGLSDERSQVEKSAKLEELRLSQIDTEVTRLEALLARTPEIAEEYAALLRLEQILLEDDVEYLRKLKNAELALSLESAQQGARLSSVDRAVVPTTPLISRGLMAAGGGGLALVFSILVGIARELLNPVIIDEQHLEETLSIPVLGSISKIVRL